MNKAPGLSKFMIAALVIFCVFGFVSQAQAIDLAIDDSRYIGQVIDGAPSNPDDQIDYINFLLDQPINTFVVDGVGNEDFDRSANTCATLGGCVDATTVGDVSDIPPATVTNLGSGFLYLYVKYGGESNVWYIGGLAGTIGQFGSAATHTFPSAAASHYALVNPTTTVPEPSSLLLLGSGLVALTAMRRRWRK